MREVRGKNYHNFYMVARRDDKLFLGSQLHKTCYCKTHLEISNVNQFVEFLNILMKHITGFSSIIYLFFLLAFYAYLV